MFRLLFCFSLFLSFIVGFSSAASAQGPGPEYAEKMRRAMESRNNQQGAKPNSKGNSKAAQPSPAGSETKTMAPDAKKMASTAFEPFSTKPVSLMAVLDTDGDGQLSGEELDFATDQLMRLDVNDNGSIEAEELPSEPATAAVAAPAEPDLTSFDPNYAGPGAAVYKNISSFDKNGDGVLTRSEIRADYGAVFRTMDTSGDRKIDPAELMEYVKNQ